MSYVLYEILSYSIVLPVVLAWLRWPNMDRRFFPFVLVLTVGLMAEIISTISINLYKNNAITSNIYNLVEAVLILWQFERWGLFARKKKLFPVLLFFVILVWSVSNLILGKIGVFDSYYRVILSFLLVLLSVQQVNITVTEDRSAVIKNPVFQICIAFIFFFTYKTLVEIFYIYGINQGDWFKRYVYRIITFVNVFVNLLFAIAVLWIPRKPKSLLQ